MQALGQTQSNTICSLHANYSYRQNTGLQVALIRPLLTEQELILECPRRQRLVMFEAYLGIISCTVGGNGAITAAGRTEFPSHVSHLEPSDPPLMFFYQTL